MASDTIASYFTQVLRDYDRIRGKDVVELGVAFWDVVVITTADKDQSDVYESQLKLKYERHELPLGVPIHVIHDPPGPKIGNGGSTLTALKFLENQYMRGDQGLLTMRVLLIHAGGQSQRMPSASILGKIFSPIPKGNPIYQMLDIKLANFCPLIKYMCPGVFVTCADDFVVYRLPQESNGIKCASSGFTALAHPSTLATGTGHGVYVLDDLDQIDPMNPIQMCHCKQVLQKPSEKSMYEKGAVLKTKNLTFSDGIKVDGRAVYTDSTFFFAHDVTKKFLEFYDSFGPVACEIDAYGDFLQALGPGASDEYIHNTSNVSTITPRLHQARQAVYNLLKGSQILLMVMNCSKFIHIGTTKEYIDSFCCESTFQEELGLSKDVFNFWATNNPTDTVDNVVAISSEEPPVKKQRVAVTESDTSLGCVMHSVLPLSSTISETSVVEYCNFHIPVNVGHNCIVSNCELVQGVKTEGAGDVKCPDSIVFPNDIFIHTIPVIDEGVTMYATVVFDIRDNLKKVANNDDILKLPFLGKYVEDYAATVKIDLSKVKAGMDDPESKVNLWFSCLFPMVPSMSQSLLLALTSFEALKKDDTKTVSFAPFKLVSMATILKQKDVFTMLHHRKVLFKKIKSIYSL